jgi:hypothetical protein
VLVEGIKSVMPEEAKARWTAQMDREEPHTENKK